MKKIISFICSIFLGITCLFSISCSRVKFSLRFMVDDTVYATVSTSGNETIKMPKDPVKEEYTFDGWYWDKDIWKNQFTASSLMNTPLSSNMEVYAHFIDESYLKGTDINIKTAEKLNVEGIGEVFYLTVRNNQLVCKFNDFVEINPHSSWILTKDINGNEPINSKTITLEVGDNPLYYIYVTDKNDQHETYVVLVHRNRMFSVSFNSNGGSQCPSQEVEEGYYLENIPTTTRKGYEFSNWDYDFENNPIKNNVVAKAIWTANQYTITYNPNGGYIGETSQIVTYDQRYTLSTPTRNGYAFKGWKYNGYNFDNSGIWSLDQNIVLTAEWEIIYYSITYELYGGTSWSTLKSSYTVNDSFTLPNPSKTGYTFKGWSLEEKLTDAQIDFEIKKGTTGNLKFYAKWEANTYIVTYDVNGGDPLDSDTQKVTFDANTTLAEPTRTGYNFAGWYNGSSRINNGAWTISNDATLTARWEAIQYAIKYKLNGGTNNANNPYNYTIESETITLDNPQKEGYTFVGWTGEDIDSPTFNLTIPHGSTGDKTFAAHWDANTYSVTYDVNGGNPLVDNVEDYIFDTNVNLLEPTRPGYVFAGWYYGEQLVASGPWKIADNITLVARWSIIDFNIQYNLDGGNNDQNNPNSYTYDDEIITLNDASRIGYTFLGWTSADISTPTKGIQIVHNSTGDKLFTAHWQANTYTVTYDVNGGNAIEKTSEEIVFDQELTLVNPIRTGYTFSGWYENNTLFESGIWKTPKDVNLVARWTPNKYTITKENGSGAGASTVTYDANYNLGQSSKNGYEFTGWFTNMYGQGTKYTDNNGDSLKPYTDANDLTLYASFVYHITFVSNGGSYVPELTLYENECLSEAIISEKENRTFAGWFRDPELTQPVSHSEPLGNITLYAKWAEEVEPTKLSYVYVSSTQLTIKGMSYSGTNVILPSHIGGEPVKAIDSQAFKYMAFSSMEIPETITSIGYNVFQGCSSLTTLTIPFVGKTASSKTTEGILGYLFGQTSFDGATKTQNYSSGYYYIPNSLKDIKIASQTSISNYAFYNCNNIQSIVVPDNLETIGNYAFAGCTSLKRINSDIDNIFNIPSTVVILNDSTFQNCSLVKEINISNNVASIGNYAFNGCTGVTRFNSSNEGHLNVPTSCQSIGQYAFKGMSSITDVVVPNTTSSIGYESFSGFSSLVNLTVPFVGRTTSSTGTEGILGYIFGQTSYTGGTRIQNYSSSSGYYYIPTTLRNITVTAQTSISNYAFYNCSNLQSITLPENLTSIGSYVFAGCSSLKRINSDVDGVFSIPSGVIVINNATFQNCSQATDINVSNFVTSIGDYAFNGCISVTKFNSSNDGHLNVPTSCQSIGQYAFKGMSSITDVVVPSATSSIGYESFSGFSSLVNLTVPFVGNTASSTGTNGVLGYIFGQTSYSGSTKTQNYSSSSGYYYIPDALKNITISSQTFISSYAFYNCSNIEKINYLEYQNIYDIPYYAFANCSSLLYLNSSYEGEFNISSSTNYIGDGAFLGCANCLRLNSNSDFTLNIPTSCQSIGQYAFKGLALVKTISIPNSVTTIGYASFSGFSSLVNLTIPFVGRTASSTGTEGILGYIFGQDSYTGGTRIQNYSSSSGYYYIPTTLRNITVTAQTSISNYAFYNCSNLQSITIPQTVKTIGSYVFAGCSSLKRINSDVDGVFNIPSKVRIINDGAFQNCSLANDFCVSNFVTSIGNYAFNGCISVTKFNSSNDGHLNVPTSCQSIGQYAFKGMSSITDVVVHNSAKTIGYASFSGFSSLVNLTIPFVGNTVASTGTNGILGYIFGQDSYTGGTRIQNYSSSSGYYYIPATLRTISVAIQTSLPSYAFYNCNNLETINLLKDADSSATNCLTNCSATVNKILDEAPDAPWNGTSISEGFSSGSGTIDDPYVINSASDLAYLAQQVNNGNSFAGVYFVLGNSMNLNGHSLIIGDSLSHPFCGTINGNGNTIQNLTINSSGTYVGLFGYFNGTIYNIGFENVSITSNTSEEAVYTGVFGYVGSDAIIHDVYSTGTITASGQSYCYAGGLIGYCEGTIYNSYSRCNVSSTSIGYIAYAGGLVGYLDNGSVANCFTTGNVSAKGATTNYSRNGGLVGMNNNGTIKNCYRSSSQTLTRNGTSNSSYNEEGTVVSFEGSTGDIIIENFGWDFNIWDGSEDFPLFK